MTPDELQSVVLSAYESALTSRTLMISSSRWVMDRAWYDRLYRAFVDPKVVAQIRSSHATTMIPATVTFPRDCPACQTGPFATMDDLAEHVMAMATDPQGQSSGTCLFGLPIDVQDHGGAPHLEGPEYANAHHA